MRGDLSPSRLDGGLTVWLTAMGSVLASAVLAVVILVRAAIAGWPGLAEALCRSVAGVWAASLKLTDCPMPSWHTVQPVLSMGCGELLPTYRSRSGCVLNGCGYFS